MSADGANLNLDRTFTFSTSACDFLSKNGFDFGKVFKDGIPYLSRDEEVERREEYAERANKNKKIPNIVIAPEDSATLEFTRLARKTISTWAKDPKVCNLLKLNANHIVKTYSRILTLSILVMMRDQ